MPSSCSKKGLQGPRPQPLKISPVLTKNKKQPIISIIQQSQGNRKSPVVVYLHTPRVIHAKPHEFMSIVQKLTGKSSSPALEMKLDSDQVGLSLLQYGLYS
jgi:MAP kinase substrate 1